MPQKGRALNTQTLCATSHLSGTYFARIRVYGKLIVRSLKTDALTVAKLRLADLEKAEWQAGESKANAVRGKLSFEDATQIYAQRIPGDRFLAQKACL